MPEAENWKEYCGMTYAPGIEEFVTRANSVLPPEYHTRPLAEQRRLYSSLVHEFPFPRPAGVAVREDTVRDDTWRDAGEHDGAPEGGGSGDGRAVPVRVYRPARRTGRGAYLYLHG